MTELRKRVQRKTVDPVAGKRKIIVSLLPGDVIEMREEWTRRAYSAPLSRVYRQIVTWNVDAERQSKKAKRGAT